VSVEADAAARAVWLATAAAPGETGWDQVAERVSRAVAEAEPAAERAERGARFADWIRGGAFLPSIPTLSNAGRGGQLAACFVLEPSDSLDAIYAVLARAARIQQGSGGVGVHFSRLRPRGAPIERSGGHSPGPEAFVELFAHSAQVNAMAGRRAGAHLAVLRDDHPDVLEFVRARRTRSEALLGVGLAVGVSDALLEAARRDAPHALRDPRGGEAGRVSARALLDEIARSIHDTGDPTLLFLDRIARDNPVPALGRIEATNPCGEQPLLPDESCVLGSLHLPAFADARGRLDAARLRAAARDAIRFLDDVVDVNAYPDEGIAAATRRTRKVGLGVMGFADLLLLRGVAYGSESSVALAHECMALVEAAAREASAALADERGPFPAWSAVGAGPRRRNATCLAVAPTGTLRLLARCNGGLEPLLDPVLRVRTPEGRLRWCERSLEEWLASRTADPEGVLDALERGAPAAELPGLDPTARAWLRPAWEVPAEAQIALQCAFQTHVDGAVSKTVHLPEATSAQRIAGLVAAAREAGCKGVAFWRRAGNPGTPEIDLTARVCIDCQPAR
jgi:ribonucleoside-diphosphate reductase alpha chain